MRRYTSRQNVSFERGADGSRHARNIVNIILIAVLLALLLVFFLLIQPSMSSNTSLQEKYLTSMKSELKSAMNAAETLSRNGGWESYVNVAKVRSCVYALANLYQQYRDVNGSTIEGFDQISELISVIDDQYIPSLNQGGTQTGTVVTEIQNRLNTMNEQINPQY